MKLIGTAVRRLEDEAVLMGRTRYLDDVSVPGVLHCSIVRSQFARADLTSIDVSAAEAIPGVVAVFTADDLGPANGPIPQPTWFPPPEELQQHIDVMSRPEYMHLLAPGHVRYVGEPIAVVVATSPYVATDSAFRIYVDYEARQAVVDVDQSRALLGGALNDGWPDNLAARFVVRKGDVDRAFSQADRVVSGTFRMGRQTGTPIEPRGVLADPTRSVFTVWSSNQAPHWLRDALAAYFGVEAPKLRVVAPDVGGGFGIKSMVYPEEMLIPEVARRLGSPVKWVETRTENFLAAVHARDQRHHMQLALAYDGEILGLRDTFVTDAGASNLESLVVPYITAAHLQGSYRVPTALIVSESYITNKAPLSAYRGAGRPEAVFAMERIIDLAARELGIDRAVIRQKNLITGDEMPYDVGIRYRDGNALSLDGGDYKAVFDQALLRAGVANRPEEQARAEARGRLLGIGYANYIEGTGVGPREQARATIEPDGRVSIVVAIPSQGQGHPTTLAQVAADSVGVPARTCATTSRRHRSDAIGRRNDRQPYRSRSGECGCGRRRRAQGEGDRPSRAATGSRSERLGGRRRQCVGARRSQPFAVADGLRRCRGRHGPHGYGRVRSRARYLRLRRPCRRCRGRPGDGPCGHPALRRGA